MQRKLIIKFFVIINIMILISDFAYAVDSEQNIVMGIPSKKSALSLLSRWQPIADELSKRSGYQIKISMVKDHEELIKKMKNKEIDLGYYSPVFFVRAKAEIEITPIVMRVKYGSPYYRSGFITRKDSIINSIQDLKNKKIALTAEEDSTSGYYIPLAMLSNNEIEYQKNLDLVFTGKHINVLKSVVYGSVDAGAIKLYILDDPQNYDLLSEIKVLERSFFIPGSLVAVINDLDLVVVNKIKNAFLSLSTDESGLNSMKAMNFNGFVLSNDELYNPVRNYLEELK